MADPGTTAESQVSGPTWVWEWNRETDQLEKVRIPGNLLPADWIEPLQRHYAPGDRVLYTIGGDQDPQPGTVVKDQGMYVAIDGDSPGAAATAHKTHVHPHTNAHETRSTSEATTTSPAAIVVSPHVEPTRRTDARGITARWNVGELTDGWQQQSCLDVQYVNGAGYRATLRTIWVRHTVQETREVISAEPATVTYSREAPRFSAKGLRESYQAALDDVRYSYDSDDRTVVTYFQAGHAAPPA